MGYEIVVEGAIEAGTALLGDACPNVVGTSHLRSIGGVIEQDFESQDRKTWGKAKPNNPEPRIAGSLHGGVVQLDFGNLIPIYVKISICSDMVQSLIMFNHFIV